MSGEPPAAPPAPPDRPALKHPAVWLATWFGVGLLPVAPGTWGSLAALPAAFAIQWAAGPAGLAVATAAVFGLGWWAADRCARGRADPGWVVIDEVAGQWLVLIAVPATPLFYAIGFGLFRFADITKPWPANWAERRLPGGLGIMADDMIAGAYAGAILYFLADWMTP